MIEQWLAVCYWLKGQLEFWGDPSLALLSVCSLGLAIRVHSCYGCASKRAMLSAKLGGGLDSLVASERCREDSINDWAPRVLLLMASE